MRICLLEDDSSLQKGISIKLKKEGYEPECFSSAADIHSADLKDIDIAILDINLPDGNGLEICGELRALLPHLYIIMLTAYDSEIDVVTGYEFGADDYVTKPFSLSVLLSKINAVKRRKESGVNPVELDLSDSDITIRGKKISLTRNEARLFRALMQNAGQILTKEQLLNALWDIDGNFVNENTLAVNIRRLREKIENNPAEARIIENVRGIGYRLNKEEV